MNKSFFAAVIPVFVVACGSGGTTSDVVADSMTDMQDSCDNRCKAPQVCFQGQCCEPFCQGRECGDDGCGGTCGSCQDGKTCFLNTCCTPNCNGLECGDNGCGGQCGQCGDGLPCMAGTCCVPVCGSAKCGEDSCGRPEGCGKCAVGFRCKDGECCKQQCAGMECGDDGCGGTCGECASDRFCESGTCRPKGCEGRWCGIGIGGVDCGTCKTAQGEICYAGSCCTPDCGDDLSGKICGTDGCGGSCGSCEGDKVCCFDGSTCCPAECGGRECGPDGQGGYCGPECPNGHICTEEGKCCQPYCPGQCGDDGCGGSCGTCKAGVDCHNYFCPQTTNECLNGYCESCNPKVENCDGVASENCRNCPGDCGCTGKYECINDRCCIPECGTRECGDNGCGVPCGLCGHGAVCSPAGMCEPCDDECTPGQYCTADGTGVWTCTYAVEGCNRKMPVTPCQFGCSPYINDCMNECPVTNGKCSAPGSYKCFNDLNGFPQCVFICPTDPSIPSSERRWTALVNCSASGDRCMCGEFEDIAMCMTSVGGAKPCYGERLDD